MPTQSTIHYSQLAAQIRDWAAELGFQQMGISDTGLDNTEKNLQRWLNLGYHGDMAYMSKHGLKRTRPEQLIPGTVRVISLRMNYFSETIDTSWTLLQQPDKGYISRYAYGRDYHKTLRKRLQQLITRISQQIGPFNARGFVDSAPVMEKPLAQLAGLGWQGKHTNLIHPRSGSFFFLGEIYTDLPLPIDSPAQNHCGKCQACIDICPTQAIVAPYQLDARRCISYLTIEHHGAIPVELRPAIGNRIYGCDDCQLICPWNRFATHSNENDFQPRNSLDAPALIELFNWDEKTFLKQLEGSPIRRIGHERWLRNIAVALGNGVKNEASEQALRHRFDNASPLVREHIEWALEKLCTGYFSN